MALRSNQPSRKMNIIGIFVDKSACVQAVVYPGTFFGEGEGNARNSFREVSTNSVQDKGQRKR
jgi:hypothetical protein